MHIYLLIAKLHSVQRSADIYIRIHIEVRLKSRPFAEKRASTRILKGPSENREDVF
jgi:hypothetical protein